jgi:hypothetical protein
VSCAPAGAADALDGMKGYRLPLGWRTLELGLMRIRLAHTGMGRRVPVGRWVACV